MRGKHCHTPGLGPDFVMRNLSRELESAREEAVSPSPFPARNKEEFIPRQSLINPGPTGPPRLSISPANKGVGLFQNRVVRAPAGSSRLCPAPKSVGRGGILPEAGLWALLPWGLLLAPTSSLCSPCCFCHCLPSSSCLSSSQWKLHIERVPVDDVAAWLRAFPSEFGSSAFGSERRRCECWETSRVHSFLYFS